jgi:hypothetical protein
LVKEFGYDKEPRINKMVLNNTKNEYNSTQPQDKETLNHLFASKDYNGSLQIREGLLQTVVEETNVKKTDLFELLEDYCFNLAFPFPEDAKTIFNFHEKCKIIAHITNVLYPLCIKLKEADAAYWVNPCLLSSIYTQKPEIIEEIVKNNYFGFPNLETYIEEVKEEHNEKIPNEEPEAVATLIKPDKKPQMLGGHILVDPY